MTAAEALAVATQDGGTVWYAGRADEPEWSMAWLVTVEKDRAWVVLYDRLGNEVDRLKQLTPVRMERVGTTGAEEGER